MTIPDLNSKRLKRLDNHHFTVEPLSAITDPDLVLCNHCAVEKCRIRNSVKRHSSDAVTLKVQSCKMFIPALGFSVLQGLDLDDWNTVRIGGAWADRLTPGRLVAIVDAKKREITRYMRVSAVFSGSLGDMLEEHARNNHAIQAEVAAGKTQEEDVKARLERILKNAYGTNIAAANRIASVIYVQP